MILSYLDKFSKLVRNTKLFQVFLDIGIGLRTLSFQELQM